jgi:hypothetical protein
MVRRGLVGALLATLLFTCGAVGHSWISIGQGSGYLSRSGDYDVWKIDYLGEGVRYRFTCTVPWDADFDMKLFFDLNDDGKYVDEDWFSTWAGERIALATGTGRPSVLEVTPWFSQADLYGWHYVIKVYSYYGYGSYTLTYYRWGH